MAKILYFTNALSAMFTIKPIILVKEKLEIILITVKKRKIPQFQAVHQAYIEPLFSAY